MKELQGMGKITIKAHRVIRRRRVQGGLQRQAVDHLSDIPEKALKGRALSVRSFYIRAQCKAYTDCVQQYIASI